MGRVSVRFDLFLYGNFSRAKTSATRLMGKSLIYSLKQYIDVAFL